MLMSSKERNVMNIELYKLEGEELLNYIDDNSIVVETYRGVGYTRNQLNEMRDWFKMCQWEDYTEDDFDGLTDLQVLKGIEKHVDGGLLEFINNLG